MSANIREIDSRIFPTGSWVRSSWCVPNGNCVELNPSVAEVVGVRDSKGDATAFLTFDQGQWLAFLTRCRSAS